MNTHVLVKYSFDYADEFSVSGFGVYTIEEWSVIKSSIKNSIEINPDKEYYFGTNEYLTFSDYESWESGLDVIYISQSEAKVLGELFQFDLIDSTFGVATNVIRRQDEEDEDEDEDY